MKEILLLNPRKRRAKKKTTRKRKTKRNPRKKTNTRRTATRKRATVRRVATKGASTMAKRRRKRTTKRRVKRNPSRTRRAARAVSSRARGAFGGLNFKSALKNIPMNTLGMFAAKWAAKRWGQPATETDPASWNYASYLKGAAGAAGAGFLANMMKPGSGQRVLEGGMSLMLYKLVQNELIPKSQWATNQFGANMRTPGTIEENDGGEPFILGEDMEWYPLYGADDYRMIPDSGMYGDALTEPGPLGEALTPPGPLGAENLTDIYGRNFLYR